MHTDVSIVRPEMAKLAYWPEACPLVKHIKASRIPFPATVCSLCLRAQITALEQKVVVT